MGSEQGLGIYALLVEGSKFLVQIKLKVQAATLVKVESLM
jgi:hypothetical protein